MARRKKKGQVRPAVGDKPFRYVHLRVFAHATEDVDKVESALARAAGYDPDDPADVETFRKAVKRWPSQGHFNNPITILEAELGRKRDIRAFWDNLFGQNGMRDRLAREAPDRLDDELTLWVRLDKQAAYAGTLRLSRGEDVVLARAKVATYPKDRGTALRFLKDFFQSDEAAHTAPAPAGGTSDEEE